MRLLLCFNTLCHGTFRRRQQNFRIFSIVIVLAEFEMVPNNKEIV